MEKKKEWKQWRKVCTGSQITICYLNFYHIKLTRTGTVTKNQEDSIWVFIDEDREYRIPFPSIHFIEVRSVPHRKWFGNKKVKI